mgnify:CR=1 FL=1
MVSMSNHFIIEALRPASTQRGEQAQSDKTTMALSHLFSHIRTYGLKHKPLYAIAMMILFFSIFNGIVAYITPLLMEERGLSKTMLGIIYGTSSVAGALFDFLLCRFLSKTNFRRVFIFMFAICLVYPLILIKATTAVLFIIPMALPWTSRFISSTKGRMYLHQIFCAGCS